MRLLNRTIRSIPATEAGKAYLERLRPLLDEYDHLDLADRDASQTPRGRLRLTAPLSFGVIEFAPALNDFALRYPEIKLDVIFADRITNLLDEGFDMAIRIGRSADSRLGARKLCDVRIVVVGAPAYFDRMGEPNELAGHASGACRMGADDAAVVDPQLRVNGIRNLRIADSSIMPRIVSVPTMPVCAVIGARAADLLSKG